MCRPFTWMKLRTSCQRLQLSVELSCGRALVTVLDLKSWMLSWNSNGNNIVACNFAHFAANDVKRWQVEMEPVPHDNNTSWMVKPDHQMFVAPWSTDSHTNFTWKKARKNFRGTKARKANWAFWWVSLIFLALAFYTLYTLAAKTNRKAARKVLIRKKDTFSRVCHSFLQLPTIIFDSVPDTTKSHKNHQQCRLLLDLC